MFRFLGVAEGRLPQFGVVWLPQSDAITFGELDDVTVVQNDRLYRSS